MQAAGIIGVENGFKHDWRTCYKGRGAIWDPKVEGFQLPTSFSTSVAAERQTAGRKPSYQPALQDAGYAFPSLKNASQRDIEHEAS